MAFTLVIANKAYSSWSLRPWMVMRHFGIAFDEVTIPMDQPDTRAAMLRYAPTGKCPILLDDTLTLWDSLAIIDHLAERFADLPFWPAAQAPRALARSLVCEMHSGFQGLRGHMPMNMRRAVRRREATPEAAADIARVTAAWTDARERFGADGPFLFGRFCAADAFYAPVVNRLHIYDVPVETSARAYMDAVIAHPAYAAWTADAAAEPWHIDRYDSI